MQWIHWLERIYTVGDLLLSGQSKVMKAWTRFEPKLQPSSGVKQWRTLMSYLRLKDARLPEFVSFVQNIV